MDIEIKGTKYEILRSSDLQRDGMFLEASISGTDPVEQIAEVFYSDQAHDYSVSCFAEGVPLELVEFLISSAKERLPIVSE